MRFVGDVLRAIKAATLSEVLPEGVGITLCVGEQSPETYAEWFAAGKASLPVAYGDFLAAPVRCLALRPTSYYDLPRRCPGRSRRSAIGVGTGVMIGLPGQTLDSSWMTSLHDIGADMVGMGPAIPHEQAVLTGTIPDVLVAPRAGGWHDRRDAVYRCRRSTSAATTAWCRR